MNIAKANSNPTVLKALLIYFSVLFSWQFVFSFLPTTFDNVDFVVYAATAASIYWIAKTTLKPDFLGRSLKLADTAGIALLVISSVLLGVGSWALLVFLDATVNGQQALDHWKLISRQEFDQIVWYVPWIVGDFITSSILGPIVEEIVFRGFILTRLRKRYSPNLSVMISAALFAVLHFNKNFLGAFVHGIIFAMLVIRTSSIYASILVHGLYNAMITVLMVGFGFSIVGDVKVLSNFNYWVPEFVCGLIGTALLAVYFLIWPSGHHIDPAVRLNSDSEN